MAEKIGVYVCHCGSNIAGKVDVEEVAKWASENVEGVVVARDYKFMCSDLGQKLVADDIKRVVLAEQRPEDPLDDFDRGIADPAASHADDVDRLDRRVVAAGGEHVGGHVMGHAASAAHRPIRRKSK